MMNSKKSNNRLNIGKFTNDKEIISTENTSKINVFKIINTLIDHKIDKPNMFQHDF